MTDKPGLQNIEDILPLTPMQQFTLLEATHAPDSIAYHEQFTFLLRGPLDLDAYQRAWSAVINRHAALRATFLWPADKPPMQVILKKVSVPWEIRDWHEGDDESMLREYLSQDRTRLFRFDRVPLMRFLIVRLGPQLHRVVWSFHHILVDAWSVSIVLADVEREYQSILTGVTSSAAAAASLKSALAHLKGQSLGHARAYWQDLLADLDGPTPMPASRRPEDVPGRAREPMSIAAALNPQDYERLRVFSREKRITLSTIMLAAWCLVQSRWTRSSDVIVGTTFSGRTMDVPNVDQIVGLMMNAAPVRTRFLPHLSAEEFLRSLQRQMSESVRHEQTPLTEVQRASGLPAGTALFNSNVVFGNYPLDDARAGQSVSLRIEEPRSFGWTNLPLTLMVTPWKTFDIEARFDASEVDAARVQRLLDDVRLAMLRLVEQAAKPLDSIDILPSGARERSLTIGSGRSTNEPAGALSTIHGVFADRVKQSPRAVAYRCGGSSLTYAALDEQSAAIATHLLAMGVTPGSAIGVCIEPSLELPSAMLGVLRANCCYVPLDPTYPTSRLEHIVVDSKPAAIVCSAHTRGIVPAGSSQVVEVGEAIRARGPLPEPSATTAYITYTSGSTGLPKGVRGTHRGAMNRFRWMWAFRPFQEDEASSWATTINFVDHVWEAFGPMLAGIPVEILQRETVKDPRALIAALRKARITRMVVVPALLEAMLDAHTDLRRRLGSLRICVSSGEALPWGLAQRFRSALPDAELINLYGSSEIAADVTYHVVTDADIEEGAIPIGRPIDNVSVMLLDHRLQPVPEEAEGVIHVSGAALAEGYHNREDLTSERFLSNPHARSGSDRLFNTGDLGKWNERRELVYCGRADSQVKIRGFRVEPGEIEHALLLHPGVGEAAVVARAGASGQALHAYISPSDSSHATDNLVADVRRMLRGRFPDYMVPSTVTMIDALPRTPNGKVNRKALPSPGGAQSVHWPNDPIALKVAQLFAELLDVAVVGEGQSFFDLGGHSLLAVRLVNRIESAFGYSLPLATLLHVSTPAQIAAAIATRDKPRDVSVLAPLRTTGSKVPFYCFHGMDGNVLFLERLVAGLPPDQPLIGVMARGVNGDAPPLTSIDEMADHYVQAIRAHQPNGPYVLGGYSLGGVLALEVAHRLAAAGETVSRVIMIDTRVLRRAGGRSLRRTLWQRMRYHFSRGPRHAARTFWIGPVERNAYRLFAALGLPLPRRLKPWPVRFANLQAYFRYQPRPWSGAITLIRAEHQEDEYKGLPALGWEKFARGTLDVRPIACDHLNFFGPRSAGVLAAELSRVLEEVQRECGLITPRAAEAPEVSA